METSDAQAIIDAVTKLSEHEVLITREETEDTAVLAVVATPVGKVVHDLSPLIEKTRLSPRFREGMAKFTELESFVAWVNRFKDSDSAVFLQTCADPSKVILLAVLDYHRIGAEGAPRFGKHRGQYFFPFSAEWRAWSQVGEMSQAQFAEFLEDRIVDVLDPSVAGESATGFAHDLGVNLAGSSSLMTLARGLSVRVEAKVTLATNLSSGESQLAFEESHRDDFGAPLKIPGGFVITVPVFQGGDLYQVPVRLRYRVKAGAVTWRALLHRESAIVDDAIKGACAKVREGTGLPLYLGTPEY